MRQDWGAVRAPGMAISCEDPEGVGWRRPPATNGAGHRPIRPMYSRVLLKLGGEMFGGGQVGLDPDVVALVARQIAEVVRSGVQVAVVIGGGNFFRGAQLQQRGMERTRSDYMGMLGTVMNSLALQDFLEKEGIATRVQTAITMGQVAEPYIPLRARDTWRRAAWSSSARAWACRTSPPTPPPLNARWRSARRWC